MPDEKKKPYLFKGSDGNTHEIWELSADHAAAKAATIAKQSNIQLSPELPNLFLKPGRKVPPTDRQTSDPMNSELDPDPSFRNRMMRLGARTLPSLAVGKPLMSIANAGIGEGIDQLTGEDHLQPPGMGEFFSEALGALIPGLADMGKVKRGPKILERLSKFAEENPYKFGGGVGAATGAAGTLGTDSDAGTFGAVGGAAGLGATGIGQLFQKLVRSTPELVNRQATDKARDLGFDPTKIDAERPGLQDMSGIMTDVSGMAQKFDDLRSPNALAAREKLKATGARTADIMKAAQETEAAKKQLRQEKADAATLKLGDFKDIRGFKEEEKNLQDQLTKYVDKSTPSAKAIQKKLDDVKGRREIAEYAAAAKWSSPSKDIDAATTGFQNKSTRLKELRKIAIKNKMAIRDEELNEVALNGTADQLMTKTGFDPRRMLPDEKVAAKWLARESPESIVDSFLKDTGESTGRAKGMISLFGQNSTEVKAVRNQFANRLFTHSVQNTGRFAGRGLSGEKFGEMLSKVDNDAINILFGNSDAASTLRGIESMLTKASSTREPKNAAVRFVLSPYSAAAAATGAVGMGGYSNPASIALISGATTIMVWRSVPEFLDKMLQKDSVVGRTIRIYAKSPTAGTLARMKTAAALENMTEPKPEESSSEPAAVK